MLLSQCIRKIETANKKGMGIIEVMIAIFLTAVGIMALLSFQPEGWKSMAQADYRGRAAGMLHKTLENYEQTIMNPCIAVTTGDQAVQYVYPSGNTAAISGDITYTVNATITQTSVTPQVYLVTVTITWRNITTGGTTSISESQMISRQEQHRFPTGCPNA